ncbi:uncharacterized protein LOC117178384 [Belonocnema kinseyi]|uniref:uncharacterized protein LOC117178384 n=1 Tax=Belonocnema kinseyi TaxID=2817044 RepID=UPI00143DB776|nr:uncharacterized protein LOC117178384 [Belonocnema kinseyi]
MSAATSPPTRVSLTSRKNWTFSMTSSERKREWFEGIPTEALRAVARIYPKLLLNTYNACLKKGIFPKQCSTQQLVLISKGKGDPTLPGAYRPLCMLDTAAKLLKKLLRPHLEAVIWEGGDLSSRRYDFKRERSTVHAVLEITQTINLAQSGNDYSKKVVLLATLDVHNAFDTARWIDMIEALKKFKIECYLKEKVLVYADDIMALITARKMDKIQWKLNQVMHLVDRRVDSHGLSLAIEKTELVLATRKMIPTIIEMKAGMEIIQTNRVLKHLVVMLDTKLTFWEHIRKASEKAATVTTALSRLMASVQLRGGLRVACSYCTVLELAALVIAGIIPIDLLALEKKSIFEAILEKERETAQTEARANSQQCWQRRWENDHRGHGYFQAYLCTIKKVQSSRCAYCEAKRDDVEHTFVDCERWIVHRDRLEKETGRLTKENVMAEILRIEEIWDAVANYVESILRQKKIEMNGAEHQP